MWAKRFSFDRCFFSEGIHSDSSRDDGQEKVKLLRERGGWNRSGRNAEERGRTGLRMTRNPPKLDESLVYDGPTTIGERVLLYVAHALGLPPGVGCRGQAIVNIIVAWWIEKRRASHTEQCTQLVFVLSWWSMRRGGYLGEIDIVRPLSSASSTFCTALAASHCCSSLKPSRLALEESE